MKEMKKEQVIIEWKHLNVEGETCDRCSDTGKNLSDEVDRLNKTLNSEGIEVELHEIKLDGRDLKDSNSILINGSAIESLIEIQIVENYCESCSSLLQEEAYCRAVVYKGKEYEEVPLNAIRDAVYHALNREEEPSFQIL